MTSLPARQTFDRPLLGIGCKLTATVLFAIMFAAIRWLGSAVPVGEIVFFRSTIGAGVVVAAALLTGGPGLLRTSDIRSHALRSSAGTISMFCNFAAYTLLPLANATAIGFAAPLFVVVLAAVMLGERVHIYRWSAVAAGFAGVIVIAGPEGGLSRSALYGALFALGGAGLQGMAMVLIRRMSAHEHSITIAFYFMLTSAAVSVLTAGFGWQWPTWPEAAVLIITGLSGGIGQIFLSFSYRYSEASVLAPFDYVAMIWAVVLGYFIFAEVPAMQVWIGSVIVIACGLLIFWRERMLGRQRELTSPAV
jgi:drug/metabolite transporter (DMT)-like permease